MRDTLHQVTIMIIMKLIDVANLLDQANRCWKKVKLMIKGMSMLKDIKYTYDSDPIVSQRRE